MTMKTEFTPEESLAVIHKMIRRTQQNISESSIHFLIWGWATLIAALTHYTLLTFSSFAHPYISWLILMPAAGITAGVVGWKSSNKRTVKTHLDSSIGYLWGGFTIFIFILLSFTPFLGLSKVYPLVMALYAFGSFVMGGIIRFKPLVIGALVCWGIAVLSFFVSFQNQLLCIAAAIAVAYLVPGYLLKQLKH